MATDECTVGTRGERLESQPLGFGLERLPFDGLVPWSRFRSASGVVSAMPAIGTGTGGVLALIVGLVGVAVASLVVRAGRRNAAAEIVRGPLMEGVGRPSPRLVELALVGLNVGDSRGVRYGVLVPFESVRGR